MANEKNLKPFTTNQSREEAKKNGRKGGIKSGEARRKNCLIKKRMLGLLDLAVTDRKKWNKLSKMGIDPEHIDNRALITVSLFLRAVEKGDVKAFKEIRNLIGESTNEEDAALNKLDEVLGEIKGNI